MCVCACVTCVCVCGGVVCVYVWQVESLLLAPTKLVHTLLCKLFCLHHREILTHGGIWVGIWVGYGWGVGGDGGGGRDEDGMRMGMGMGMRMGMRMRTRMRKEIGGGCWGGCGCGCGRERSTCASLLAAFGGKVASNAARHRSPGSSDSTPSTLGGGPMSAKASFPAGISKGRMCS